MNEDTDFLSQVPIFSRLRREDLEQIAKHARHFVFPVGDEIISEGERDGRLFVVLRGRVDVVKNRGHRNERILASLGAHEYFGEMALIDDLVRSATVVAKEETEVLAIEQWRLHEEIERNPAMAVELLRMMSRRVRALEKSLMHTLGGELPICLNCKSIRDEDGVWTKMEEYVSDHSETDFSHGMCPDCLKELYPKHFG